MVNKIFEEVDAGNIIKIRILAKNLVIYFEGNDTSNKSNLQFHPITSGVGLKQTSLHSNSQNKPLPKLIKTAVLSISN